MMRKNVEIIVAVVGVTLCLCWSTALSADLSSASKDLQVQFKADAMCCKGCAQKISGLLYATRGVKSVQADLAERNIEVVAAAEKGPSLGELWNAVEQGGGEPTQLTVSGIAISLQRQAADAPANPAEMTVTIVGGYRAQEIVQKVADAIRNVAGVHRVSFDASQDALQIECDQNVSPWPVLQAVATAGERTQTLGCSLGEFTINARATSPQSNQQHVRNTQLGGMDP